MNSIVLNYSSEEKLDSEKKIKIDTMGGQAVIEGVLMRSPLGYAVAVRKKNGDVKVKKVPYNPVTKKYKFLGLPFLRGAVSLFEMLVIGMKALDFSANEWEEENKKEDKKSAANASPAHAESENKADLLNSSAQTKAPEAKVIKAAENERTIGVWSMVFMILTSFALAMFLGVAVPNLITSYLGRVPGIHKIVGSVEEPQSIHAADYKTSEKSHLVEEKKPFIYNLVAGSIRAVILFLYVLIIAQLKDIKRIFEYHGAEHKAVFAFEKEGAATVSNSRKYKTLHPRCGTSFLAIVIFISIIVFACIAWAVNAAYPQFTSLHFALKKFILISLHILFAPIVAGISYEILKFSAKHQDKAVFRLLILPGILFQNITTKEPDDSQLQVAILSMNAALSIVPDDSESTVRIIPADSQEMLSI